MIKKIKILFLVLLIVFSIFNQFQPIECSTNEWDYYKILSIENLDGVETGLQINFTIHYSVGIDYNNNIYCNSHCNYDFSDLRFYDYDNNNLLYAYNSSQVNGDYVNVWLKIGSSLSVIMYYGNSNAESYWNDLQTFDRIINTGIVLSMPLNEGYGSIAYDYSGYNNNGIIYNAIWDNGIFGNCLKFDGSPNCNVTILDSDSLDVKNITLLVWCNSISGQINNYEYIVRKRDTTDPYQGTDYGLSNLYNSNAGIQTYCWTTNNTGCLVNNYSNVNFNTWNLLGYTYENASWINYVNNSVVSNRNNVYGELRSGNQNLYLSAKQDGTLAFNGSIAFVLIFDNVLNSTVISDIYNYYPQVFSNHLGILYLRHFINIMPNIISISEHSIIDESINIEEFNYYPIILYIIFSILLIYLMVKPFPMFGVPFPIMVICIGAVYFVNNEDLPSSIFLSVILIFISLITILSNAKSLMKKEVTKK